MQPLSDALANASPTVRGQILDRPGKTVLADNAYALRSVASAGLAATTLALAVKERKSRSRPLRTAPRVPRALPVSGFCPQIPLRFIGPSPFSEFIDQCCSFSFVRSPYSFALSKQRVNITY